MDPATTRLLVAAKEANWLRTYGHFANAVKAWQEAGCPNLPPNAVCDCAVCVEPSKGSRAVSSAR
jgi:hypothetical protein